MANEEIPNIDQNIVEEMIKNIGDMWQEIEQEEQRDLSPEIFEATLSILCSLCIEKDVSREQLASAVVKYYTIFRDNDPELN